MSATPEQLWRRFQKHYTEFPTLGLALDLSRMNFGDDFLPSMQPGLLRAFAAMAELERGAIANPGSNVNPIPPNGPQPVFPPENFTPPSE